MTFNSLGWKSLDRYSLPAFLLECFLSKVFGVTGTTLYLSCFQVFDTVSKRVLIDSGSPCSAIFG